jgi:hypothetical protein
MDRIQFLIDELGVSFGYEYVYEDRGEGRQRYELPQIVTTIDPKLTATQWCSLAMREPPEGIPESYIGGCCGNMSYCQDIINGAFRDGGFFGGSEFLEMGKMVRDHDSFPLFEAMDDETFIGKVALLKGFTPEEEGSIIDPWAILGLIFNAVEERLSPNMLSAQRPTKYRDDLPEERKVFGEVESLVRRISWADIFSRDDDPDANMAQEFLDKETPEARIERHTHHRVRTEGHATARILNFARLLEPLRKLHAYVEGIDEVFEGWAVMDPEKNEPHMTGQGPCIFKSKDDAEWLVALWARMHIQEEESDVPEHNRTPALEYEIVPVRVSTQDGLVVTSRA